MAKVNNLAYDYAAYDSDEANLPKPKIKHKRNLKIQPKAAFAIKITISVFIGLALLCSFVFGQVELSEIYSEQSSLTEELSKLQDENLSLESELESRTGLTQVEEYAEKNLGLQKLDKSQIEYVEVENDSVAEVVETEDDNIFVSIKKWFKSVLEYFGA